MVLVGFALFTILISHATQAWAATEQVIHRFSYPNGSILPEYDHPPSPLISDAAGNLYGTTGYGGPFNVGTVFELTPNAAGGWIYNLLHAFAFTDGANPKAGLVLDAAGNLYGTTYYGGGSGCNGSGCGTVFKINRNTSGSWTKSVLYRFTAVNDGTGPLAGVIFDSAGNLYGTTEQGGGTSCNGFAGCGTAFELTPASSGWKETVLYRFTGGNDGFAPYAGLILDAAGNLYGTTLGAGNGLGTAFELMPGSSGWTEIVLHTFTGGTDGANPAAGLIFDKVGNLYGTTLQGGDSTDCSGGCGTVFELTPSSSGWTENVLHAFNGGASTDGHLCYTGLIFDANGNLYGTTIEGGSTGAGTAFELTPTSAGWNETLVYSFPGGNGANDPGTLVFDQAGNLYSEALGGADALGVLFELTNTSGGWTGSILHAFKTVDGENPYSGLIFDTAGNLYGTTEFGGAHSYGSVFELKATSIGWSEKILYSFKGGNDGSQPKAGLVLDTVGDLYGTTNQGGGHAAGTVFKLTPSSGGTWTKKVIHSFCSKYHCRDGAYPEASLIFDSAGNLYGTTPEANANNRGVVFELTPSTKGWIETVLVSFCKQCDIGFYPTGALLLDEAGNLYGAAMQGGSNGDGTIFELMHTSDSWALNVLYSFSGGSDGAVPNGGLILDASGNLYGTEYYGNGNCTNCGAIFELTPGSSGKWTEQVLYSFAGGSDGSNPNGGLVFDSSGDLYGTTINGGGTVCLGGNQACGTVFKLTPSSGGGWTESVVHSFAGGKDGEKPAAGLTLDSSGKFYGTTAGDFYSAGTVFEITQ
jgi:uncharacterized repeat protein (TIGR03803 family)